MAPDCLDDDFVADVKQWTLLSARRFIDGEDAKALITRAEAAAEAALARRDPACSPSMALIVGPLMADHWSQPLLRYAGTHLLALACTRETLRIERKLALRDWSEIVLAASADDILQYLALLRASAEDGELLGTFLLALGPLLIDPATSQRDDILRAATEAFPHSVIADHPTNVDTVELAAGYALDHGLGARRPDWASWILRWASGRPAISGELTRFHELLEAVLDGDLARTVLDALDVSSLEFMARWNARLFRRLVAVAPVDVAGIIASGIRRAGAADPLDLKPFVDAGIAPCLPYLVPELGLRAARAALVTEVDPERTLDPGALLPEILTGVAPDVSEAVARVTRIWMYVLLLDRRPQSTRWTRHAKAYAVIRQFVREAPEEWLAMLRAMPSQLDEDALSTIEQITLVEMGPSSLLTTALETYTKGANEKILRAWAHDLLAHRSELSDVRDVSRELFSRVARYLDRRPTFPHPLELRSSTWLASLNAEALFRGALADASTRFGIDRQLGEDEETITKELLDSIRNALQTIQILLRGLGATAQITRPLLSTRQETKHYEHGKGLDAAVIVNLDLPGVMKGSWASLIQAKKPLRGKQAGQYSDSWQIETQQLKDLLNSCEPSVYLFYAADGETHVVPARLIHSILQGDSRLTKAKATLHYCEFRSISIPLSQYLIDLVIGGWHGSAATSALNIAHGSDRANRPRSVLDVTFSFEKAD